MDKITLLRFVGDGTSLGANANALEGEIGGSINESINKAVDMAVQAAVVQTINDGARKGHWAFRSNTVSAPTLTIPIIPTEVVKIIKEEKNELVQPQTPTQRPPEVVPAPLQSSNTESVGTSKAAEPKLETKQEVKKEEPKVAIKLGTVVDWVNVFAAKDYKSAEIAKLKPGTEVEIIKTEGQFYYVKVNNKEGWLTKRFVRVK
jgi:hypothetical protein